MKFLLYFLLWFIGVPALVLLIIIATLKSPLACLVVLWFFVSMFCAGRFMEEF
jgi:hypothetical protein